jgi:hypothetical protein
MNFINHFSYYFYSPKYPAQYAKEMTIKKIIGPLIFSDKPTFLKMNLKSNIIRIAIIISICELY